MNRTQKKISEIITEISPQTSPEELKIIQVAFNDREEIQSTLFKIKELEDQAEEYKSKIKVLKDDANTLKNYLYDMIEKLSDEDDIFNISSAIEEYEKEKSKMSDHVRSMIFDDDHLAETAAAESLANDFDFATDFLHRHKRVLGVDDATKRIKRIQYLMNKNAI
jgi:uncharacterized coiled-coil DUF342 family protein